MSQNQEECTPGVDSTCITIEHDNIQESTIIESSRNHANNNEHLSSHQPAESSVYPPHRNDANANAAAPQLESSSSPRAPINSEVLALRLACLEEEQQQQQLNNANGDRNNRHNRNIRRIRHNYAVPNLEYRKEYPITRFTRKWKRPEVQGFCCLAIEVICLSTLSVLGLQAVGYFGTASDGDHLPLTFSWKILWEFFGNVALPKKLMSCLFANLGGKMVLREEEHYAGLEPMGPMDVNYVLLDAFASSADDYKPKTMSTRARPTIVSPHKNFCEFRQGQYSLGWLVKFFLVTNFMSVLNVMTSSILYASVSVRRRKGMQVMLLLPSFFCFFVSIFQQIPISFQYNYFDQTLSKQMQESLVQSSPPFYVVPILDETQLHHKCCGTDFPVRWEAFGADAYPRSCCNTTAFDCANLDAIKREHVWSVGCFHVEHDNIHSFERWALFLYALKVIAEVGIFCTLSDLTRIDYPPQEATETSRCEYRDYQVKCRGVMHIKGVTKDGRIVVESKYFLPWRLVPSRTDMLNGVQLNMKTDQNQLKGSVEVIKRNDIANFLNEDIQIDLSRKNRGIFVFTLT